MSKTKAMSLTYPWYRATSTEPLYLVESVVDSTEPSAGDMLTKGVVDQYCGSRAWTVTIRRRKETRA